MLNTISWQQYLTAVLLLSTAWYLYVGLRYYRTELSALFKIKPGSRTAVPPVASKLNVVMGAVKPDPDTGLYPPETLIFSAGAPDDISDQTMPRGPGDDLLDEAKALTDAFSHNDDKAEFLSLLRLLISKYEVFGDEFSLPAVAAELHAYAAGRLAFTLEESEWSFTSQSSDHEEVI
ncbi:hypothetical protein INP83_12965 [Mucilaginibacter sp. 21P]|uniref:hypothetical protein n=1 Tax=Mucilaginibacter sp. 21P TaxID=2778902 RepID=UPI001C56AB6C|nr:hypothetical protein [Mucilaginibacter sp. 21P]QXV64008.1 hypothetical protein INP83_12965 [Mucilaginibacter sp. 21P]